MAGEYELKPNRAAFVVYPSITAAVVLLIVIGAIALIAPDMILLAIAACLPLVALHYYSRLVAYKKERYILFPTKVVKEGGSIISNSRTELNVSNITMVSLRLPFLEHRLFGTGDMAIQAAGSEFTEVYLNSVDKPVELYSYIEKLMKANGFRLSKSRLVQQEKPSSLGVFFETFKSFFSMLFVIFFIGSYIGASIGDTAIFRLVAARALLPLVLLVLAGMLAWSVLHFLDLKKRVYSIYSDTILFSEGFLSRNHAFIPVENLSDSTVSQTLVDKIFGLYDVALSCQGTGKEIQFKNMANGLKLESNIDALISQSRVFQERKAHVPAGQNEGARIHAQASRNALPELQPTAFTADFGMDGKRAILAPILVVMALGMVALLAWILLFSAMPGKTALPLGSVFVFLAVSAPPLMLGLGFALLRLIIKVYATRYFVKPDSFEERYDFLSSKHKEFTTDKITGVVIKEDIVDALFGTCSIEFWSIGSGEKLEFLNIRKQEGLYSSILAKLGIKQQEAVHQIVPAFSIGLFIRKTLAEHAAGTAFIAPFAALAIGFKWLLAPIACAIVLYILFIIYQKAYHKRARLTFFNGYVHLFKGIIVKQHFYALFHNIKSTVTVRYPFSNSGSLVIEVAGRQVVKREGSRGGERAVSNSFRIGYVPDISTKDELVDIILLRMPTALQISKVEQNIQQYLPKAILQARPAVANSLVIPGGLTFIFWPVWVFFKFTAAGNTVPQPIYLFATALAAGATLLLFSFIVLYVKAKLYEIQAYRIIAKRGILYKTQQSIMFDRIDHIRFYEGMLNKMFGNGTVIVNTTGGEEADVSISNIPEYRRFYEELKRHY